MAATDAVTTAAVARREARASLDRMTYHLGRGARGTLGVNREVRFLDALHRSTVTQTGRSVGRAVTGSASAPLGQKAVQALSTGNAAAVGRMKSSILADFSADALQIPRAALRGQPWRWTANASACPSCLDRHGREYSGDFVPLHPSCLCIPQPENTPGLRPLSDSELVFMQHQYGDPRYRAAVDKFALGKIPRWQLAATEQVNTKTAGLKAVARHLQKGEVSQTGLAGGVAVDTPAAAPNLIAERKLADIDLDSDTLSFHTKGGQLSEERAALHDQIVEKILRNIDEVDEPVFFMSGGGTASGKSSMLDANAKRYPKNMARVDADEIKGLLPEYEALLAEKNPGAAAFAHSESSLISNRILAEAAERNLNVLYDTVGDSGLSGLRSKVATARARGRTISVDYASNDLELALKLAKKRAEETGRHVPEYIIRSNHADVTDTFLRAIKDGGIFDDARLWDTNVYQKPRLVATYTKGGKLKVKDWDLFEDFVAKGSRSYDDVLKDLGLRGRRKGGGSWEYADDAVRIESSELGVELRQAHDAWFNGLTWAEKDALSDYTAGGYVQMNQSTLVKQGRMTKEAFEAKNGAGSLAIWEERTKLVQEALDKYPPLKTPITTYRKMSPGTNVLKFRDEMDAALKTGGKVTHIPFASTSIDPAFGLSYETRVLVEVRTKTGAWLRELSTYKNEKEWLLPQNTVLKVVGKKEVTVFNGSSWQGSTRRWLMDQGGVSHEAATGLTTVQERALVNKILKEGTDDFRERWTYTRTVYQLDAT